MEKFKNGLERELVSDIGLEREINVFFRLDSQQVRDGMRPALIRCCGPERRKTLLACAV